LGGGSTVDPATGAISNPVYNVTNVDGTTTSVTGVAGAITNLDGRVTQNTSDINNLTTQISTGEIGLVQQASSTATVTVAKDSAGTLVDFTGTAGKRKLTGLSSGDLAASSADAITGSQLFNTATSTASALGGGSTLDPLTGAISSPVYNVTNTDGTTTSVTGVEGAVSNLDGRVAKNTTDISNINNVLGNITSGAGITYFHANSALLDSQALGAESVAIGGGAVAQGQNSVALGSGASASGANSVALGQGSVASRDNTVSVGSAGSERQITNVAKGTQGTDAVNLDQLNAVSTKVDQVNQGAVKYDTNADGSPNYSSITLGGGSAAGGTVIHNVGQGTTGSDAVNLDQMNAALSKVNNAIADSTNPFVAADGNRDTEGAVATGTHSTAVGANASATGNNSVALGAGSVATEDNTVSVGSATQQRRITNVAAGTSPTDAVNMKQFNDAIAAVNTNVDGKIGQAVQSANAYTDQQFGKLNQKMNSLGAAAMAATSLIPNARGRQLPDVRRGGYVRWRSRARARCELLGVGPSAAERARHAFDGRRCKHGCIRRRNVRVLIA
jgi:autotransporter adhesin